MNALVKRDVALTSNQPGTTRDVIEVQMDLGGFPVVLMDTAGIRPPADPVEAAGIARTIERAKRADLVVWLTPGDQAEEVCDWDISVPLLRVTSKLDSCAIAPRGRALSALTGEGVSRLLDDIAHLAQSSLETGEGGVMFRARQAEFVRHAIVDIDAADMRLREAALELAADDIRRACQRIESMMDGVNSEEVLDTIFSRFCIGK